MSFQKKSIVGKLFLKNGVFDKLFSQRNFAFNEKNCHVLVAKLLQL